MLDLSKIKAKKRETLSVDPVEIFRKNSARMSESGVNDLWAGQIDALREWHAKRSESDICLVLNTGAGKTLIGGLVSQSLVNETRAKVVYACGSIQLVEQTREKFESYGLKPTTYVGGEFSNDNFDQCQAVCITTYQALFNGRSRFFNEDIEAVIFDDAHTAEGMVKNHFSLEIRRQHSQDLYDAICSVFHPYYQKMGKAGTFSEICSGQNSRVELIPSSEVFANLSTIVDLLKRGGVNDNPDTKFAWSYLKDHIDMCAILVSSGLIQITPPFIPVSRLPYFSEKVRRVYLTATMLGKDAFIRTFSRLPKTTIMPDTPAGQCERLILFPGKSENVVDDLMSARELVSKEKALIITPTRSGAARWMDVASVPDRQEFVDAINAFKASKNAPKIVAAARYDGIDLPGDTCRVLVLDGLPMGSGLLDKFQWESLRLSKTLRSIIACRVIQSMGRISRGMSDYGVVLVVEREYIKWLSQPKNQACLPEFIQKQFMLGSEISSASGGYDDLKKVMRQCLDRDEEWLDAYEAFMEECSVEQDESDSQALERFAQHEVNFSEQLWDRNYGAAAKYLASILDEAFTVSESLGAWYAHWLGHSFMLAGDSDNAQILYRRASGVSKSLPKLASACDLSKSHTPQQILEVADQFEIAGGSRISIPKNMALSLSGLKQGATTNSTEESLRALGQYLGLNASRPDNEIGTGPDVLWMSDGIAFCIEAKSGKKLKGSYTKKNVGQLMDHVNWVKGEYPEVSVIIPIFAGPEVSATDTANPSEDMRAACMEKFESLANELIAAYQDIATKSIPLNLMANIEEVFFQQGWNWENLYQSFDLASVR